ncbi:MAG: dihydrodipicolinate synthase family protein [Geminicoccaceae bacterium]|nr:dihydrodipicolinate synthase family protein [Geminicoccaceae bacterium]
MDRNSVAWSGAMPAVITPFDAKGAIDTKAFTANLERQFDHGATGAVVAGCTGEFWTLTLAERATLFRLAVEVAQGRTILAGTGAILAADAIASARAAADAGCDGVLVLPPYFVKLTDDEIFGHIETVAAASPLPVCLYNIPGNAVNAIPPALAARLADVDKVVAIKESSGDWNNFYGTHLAVADRLRVFCGPSSVFGVPAVELGADGVIDCFPNVWLPGGIALFEAAKDPARRAEAAALQATGRRLTDLFTTGGRTLYPATKAAMEMLGWQAGEPRAPLRRLEGEPLAGLERGLVELGLLNKKAA